MAHLPRHCKPLLPGWLAFLACVLAGALLTLGAQAAVPAVALYYGHDIPLGEFGTFDITVVDPDHAVADAGFRASTRFYAYVSVGEVQSSRAYYGDIPDAWKLAHNPGWRSEVIDQSASQWPAFFAERVVQPLWERGYRGFFLDTLDSYRLAPGFDEQAQQQGLVRIIELLHQRFPGIRLILNRGFDIVPQVRGKIQMVAAESLYRRWNARAKRYEKVPEADRAWLQEQLRTVQQRDGLPALVIDYVDPGDRALTRQTAERIRADGFIPWVTDAHLSSMGVGSIEVMPRRILALYSSAEAQELNYAGVHNYLQMPLNYMGYVVDYVDVAGALPNHVGADRYAGIVTWLSGFVPERQQARLGRWLQQRVARGRVPVAVFDDWGLSVDGALARSLGLVFTQEERQRRLHLQQAGPGFGFETEVPQPGAAMPLVKVASGVQAQPLVELADDAGNAFVGGAIMPWGGFVLDPYVLHDVPGTDGQARWVVDPFAFLKQALRLPDIPVPDVTTESGRRLLMAHVDGDGFPSFAEFPDTPLAAEVLLRDVFQKYRIPQTMSVIEGEVGPQGLYPELSPRMEAVARRMFVLPYMEIGTHTFSHPFFLNPVSRRQAVADGEPMGLPIPGYTLDLQREIMGSVDYINRRLAPEGKSVKVLQWPGDTAPDAAWLQTAYQAGLLNINGGDTYITRAHPSLTAVGPLGIRKEGRLQVYAPITNENIYTDEWSGPYYAYEQAIESFEMTDAPRRIKPVGIYYHVYSASKPAALRALHKVYDWAMAQSLHPVYVSDFITKVQDYYDFSVARDGDGWRLHGNGQLRTVRLPAALGAPDVGASRDVAGWNPGVDGNYVHLTGADAFLTSGATPSVRQPYLYEANARITGWQLGAGGADTFLDLSGYVPLEFALAHVRDCRVTANGRLLSSSRAGRSLPDFVQSFRLPDVTAHVAIHCTER